MFFSYYEKIGDKVRCIDEDISFALPDGWAYERLGNICIVARGGSPRPIEDYLTDDGGLNWRKIGDTKQGGKYIFSTKEKICSKSLNKTRYVCSGDFFYYMLSSPIMYHALAVGSTVKNLKSDSVKSLIVPIPPLMEQKFIAKRIEILFTFIIPMEKSLS